MKNLILVSFLLLTSCATGLRESATAPTRPNGRTVVLFLVDGLGTKALQNALKANRLPNLRRFFLRDSNSFPVGRASFPTQTYPNLSSVLTARPIGEQPVLGNHMLLPNGKVANYEDAKSHEALRVLIDSQSVIARLESEGRETASFSYVLGMNASSHMRVGITEGLDYQRHDYMSLDDRLLTSLAELLTERRDPRFWPEFVYMHLIGVDAVSHRFGPYSREALDYLTWLDGRFGPVLSALAKGEKRKQVISMLTADHGFVETKRYVSLKKKLVKADLELVITNEGRFLGLYLPKNHEPEELGKAIEIALRNKGVELTAWRRGNVLEIATAKSKFRLAFGPAACGEPYSLALLPESNLAPASFSCANSFDEGKGLYPFLVTQLARYLTAPGHPDAIVIARPEVSFSKGAKANHGGPTADETLVPLLTRGATLQGEGPVPTSGILNIVFQPLPTIENIKTKPTVRQARAQ